MSEFIMLVVEITFLRVIPAIAGWELGKWWMRMLLD